MNLLCLCPCRALYKRRLQLLDAALAASGHDWPAKGLQCPMGAAACTVGLAPALGRWRGWHIARRPGGATASGTLLLGHGRRSVV